MKYDVLVIGAGPVGTTFARYMAEKGYNVGIIEKKSKIGVPLQCAGLLGKQIKEVNILPDDLIINPFYGAYLHSPSDHILKVAKENPEAFVVDRVGYDQFLAQKASDAGVYIFLKHRVEDLNIKKGFVYIKNRKKDFKGKIIVGADGHNSLVAQKLSNSLQIKKESVMQAAQFLVDFDKELFDTDYVHLHANASISPGFIWIIPLSPSQARVGLFGKSNYHIHNNFLKNFLDKEPQFNDYSIIKKYQGRIPVYNPKRKIVQDKVILLGDAASQVKPTTGGGLIMGFKCAQIAAKFADRALNEDDVSILRGYDVKYRENFKNELKTQLRVRKIFQSLTDEDLDFMFIKLKEVGAEEIISKFGEMDDQLPLLKELFKRGILFQILPKILARGVSFLWK